MYDDKWSLKVIPAKNKLITSRLDSLRTEKAQMLSEMVDYYSDALNKFSFLLAYFNDRGK